MQKKIGLSGFPKRNFSWVPKRLITILLFIFVVENVTSQPIWNSGPTIASFPVRLELYFNIDRASNVYFVVLTGNYSGGVSNADVKSYASLALPNWIIAENGIISYTGGLIALPYTQIINGIYPPIQANQTYTVYVVAEEISTGFLTGVSRTVVVTPACPPVDFLSGLSEPQNCVNKGATATYNIALFSGDPQVTGIYKNTQWTFDWGDGTTGSYTSTADNELPPIALRTHTYPNGSSCNYIFSNTVTNPCGGTTTIQYIAVVHGRDLASDGDGYLKLIDNATSSTTVQVCEGTQTIVTIKDNSKWDCQSPSLPVGFSPIPNTSPRNVEWLYGRDPSGAVTNTITGAVAIGGGLGSAPATSGRISPSPYGPSSLSQTITIPATAVAGQYFRVYLKNWNKCNWTDPEYASTFIDIQVLAAPPAPTAPNKGICLGGDRTLTVTSAPVGTLTWYSDAALTTIVGTGASYVPSQTAVGSYDFWVTDKGSSGLMCRSVATKVTLTIMAAPATPTISYTSSTGNLVICCDPSTEYITLTATATGTTYKWYKNGIFTGLTTRIITLKFPGEGGNYTVSAVSAGPSFCESPQSAATIVTILALTDLAQPVPTTVCAGTNAYFTASSTDLTIQRWQWQVSDDNGASWGNCGNGKYNGFNTNALTVVNTPFTFNNYLYRVYMDTHHAQGDCRFFSNVVKLTVMQKPVVNPGAVLAAICQGGTTLGLGGSITGSYLTATWSTTALGAFNPDANTLNATWTPPSPYYGTAVLTLSADGGVCGISSASKTQVVYPTAKITTQPADRAICVGNNTTFTIVDDGTATITGRQWKVSTTGIGGTYTNIVNGGVYSGATTASLTLTNVTTAYTGYYYQCVLTTTGPCTVTSNNALLTVNNNPVITQTVSDQTICSGNPATITMTNSVAAPLTSYQLRNGTTNIGAPQNGTGGTLTFTASPEVTTTYNILATIVSSGCSLQVTDQAVITVNPSPTPVITGNSGPCATINATYSTLAVAGHTYLWTIDPSGTILTSPTAASIDVLWAAPGGGFVTVTETTTATSCVTAVTLVVTINPGPPATSPVISGPVWTCASQPGVIFNCTTLGDASFYFWTVPAGAVIVTGQGTNSIAVDFPGAVPGPGLITVTPQNACGSGLVVNWPITISASLSASIGGGTSPICFNTNPGILTATGIGGPPAAYTYQWFKDGVSVPGETNNTYDPGNLIANASFYCLVNSIFTCGPVSTPVRNIVVPGILTANIGGGTTPICYNTNPGLLSATGGGGLGAGSYTYLWYKNGATTGITTQTYDPGLLTATTSFYCAITSATCGTVNTPVTTITVPGVLAAAISGGVSPICYFTDPGILTANASGGNGFYTYLWFKDGVSTGFTDQTYDPGNLTATSSFYCQVTSGTCGTVSTATVTITVPGELTADISGGATPLCYNASPGTFTVSATGGTGAYSYMWYKNGIATGATGLNYAPGPLTSTSTIYCAVTSGTCGTVNSAATTITVYDDLTATLSGGTSPICYNTNPGVMTANAAGATGTYTYLWYKNGSSTGVTTQTYDPGNLTTSATYYCAVTSGACGTVSTAISTIVVYNNLAASISGGISTICYNTSPGVLTAVASGGTGTYSYLWYKDGVSTGITFQTYDPGNLTALTNVFYCEVTSGTCGMTATAPLTVNVPGVLGASLSGGTPSICYNTNPGMLTATGAGGINVFSYLWYKNGISTGITTANYDPGNLTSTSAYYCAITSGTCGTVNSTPVTTITVNPNPAVSITNPATVCSPVTVDLTAAAITAGSTAGLTFTYWTNAICTVPYATPAAATTGTYYIKGTTAAGCFDIKPVVVTVNPTPTLVITNPAAVCAPATIDITAAAVTASSTGGLTISYWTDAAATTPYFLPTVATAGTYYIKGTTALGCYDIKPVVVTINPKPTLLITNPAALCSPATIDITLPAVTLGSTAGLTLTYWTDAAATIPFATPGTAITGTYYIKGTIPATGCYNIQPVTVTVNPKPTVSITNPAAVCSPSTVNLTVAAVTFGSTAGLTYTYWTDATATTALAVPTAVSVSGTYYIKGTVPATGCYDIQPVTVTVNPKPTVSITSPSAVCSPSTVDLTAAAVTFGSTPGLNFTYWTDLAGTIPNFTPTIVSSSGTYYIKGTVPATGCYDIQPVVVTINPKPTLTITNPAALCSPATIDITAAAVTFGSTAGLTYTYWTDATATTALAVPTAVSVSGTYYIKGTTPATGCYDIKPVTVTVNPKPTVSITNPAAVCSPSTVDLTVAAVTFGSTAGLTYTYWTDATATTALAVPTAVSVSGTYYIKGTVPATGCYDIQPVTVTVNPKPTVSITSPAAVCSPSTVDLTVAAVTFGSTPGLSYSYWTDLAGTIPNFTPTIVSSSGTYYIKGTVPATGCYDIQPVTVTVNPKPTVSITSPAAVCSPSTVDLTVAAVTFGSTAGLTYTYWTDATATTALAVPTAVSVSGIYYIKGTIPATGCYDIKPVTVTVNPKPTVSITNPAAVCSPSTVDLTVAAVTFGSTAGLSYTYWTDATATTVLAVPIAVSVSGTYYIKGTVPATGCYDIQPVTVTVNPKPTVSITNPAAVCSPSTVDLTVAAVTFGSTAGLTYTYWTDATATTVLAVPTAVSVSGTYYIKGTVPATGCYDIQPVVVTINPKPTLTITNPAALCSPATIDITAAAVTFGSTAGLTYTYWTDATATTALAVPTAVSVSGTYYIKGTIPATGCYNIQPVTVTVNPKPTVSITNPAAVCSPSTVDLTVAAVTFGSTAGLTYTYWTDATATTVLAVPIAVSVSGTYYIKGTVPATGCYDIQPVVVTINPKPTLTITNPAALCSPATIDITAAAVTFGSTAGLTYTYWTDATATTALAVPTAVSVSGTYYIKGTIPATGCYNIQPVTVTVNPKPTISITNPAAVCSPSTVNLTVAAVTFGSTAGLTYTYWTDATATTALVVPTAVSVSGTYYIKGTVPATGCYDIQPVTVTVNPKPTVSITSPAAVCSPSTVDLTAAAVTFGSTAGLSYSYWTDLAGTIPNFTPTIVSSSGTYYIKGTVPATGCYDIQPVTVTVNPKPTVSITSPAAVCSPSTVDLTVAAVTFGSTAGLTYTYWTDATATTALAVPTAVSVSGIYYIKGTIPATGCYDIKPVTVTVNPKPTISITNPAAVCSPSTVDLTVAAVTFGSTAGLTYTYWTDATATTVLVVPIAVSVSGTYYIKGTVPATGCYDIKPVTVTVNPKPTVSITNPAAVCSPSTVDLTVAAVTFGSTAGLTYTYWTDATATTVLAVPIAVSVSGTYYIKGTVPATGCYDIKPVTVTVNPTPTLVITNPSNVCSPSTADLTAATITTGSTLGLTLTYWTDALATTSYATPANAPSGTYYIKGTTAAGCFDIKSVTVTINPTPTVAITSPAALCSPSTADLTAAAVTAGSTAGLSFSYWLDAAMTTPFISPTVAGAGTYYIKGIAATGCFDVKPVLVTVNPKPTLAITNPPAICSPATENITLAGVTAGSTAGLTLTYWTDAAATVPYATPSAATSGIYYIKGATGAGCFDIKPVTVTINPTPTVFITNPAAVCSPATVNLTQPAVTAGSTAGLTFTYWIDALATTPYGTPGVATAGTYYIKGTTAQGCYGITAVTVTVNPAPTLVINPPAAVCSPSTVNLTTAAITAGSTAGLTLTYWTDALATTPYFSATVATAGTYYIKGTTALGCYDIKPVTVTVDPVPTLVITSPAPVCPAVTTDLTLGAVTAGSTAGLTLTYWTNALATIAYATPAAATAGTYYIKGVTGTGCYDIKPVTVTTNPVSSITDMTMNICSGATFTTVPVDGVNGTVLAGTIYSWPAPAVSGGITGGLGSGGSGANITGTLVNPTNTIQTATYTVTPQSAGCSGPTFRVTVTVNPKPAILPQTANICSGGTFSVTPVNVTDGVVPAFTTYSWSAPAGAGITGGSPGSGASVITGMLSNLTSSVKIATYTITPQSGSCTGTPFTLQVNIDPAPSIMSMSASVCSGVSFTVTPLNGANGIVPPGTTYSWAAPAGAGFTGGTTGSSSPDITGTITNTTSSVQPVAYTVTPVSGACTGTPFQVTVMVNPKPAITDITYTVCSGSSFTVTPVDATNGIVPAGTLYSWAAPSGTGFIGGAPGSSSPGLGGTLFNSTNTQQTATYTVTPVTGTCTGTPFVVTIKINPTPVITNITTKVCSGSAFTITPADVTNGVVPSGTTLSWPAPIVTGGLTGGSASAGTPSAISGTLTNPTTSLQTATYNVIPVSSAALGSCTGTPFTVIISVKPLPAITASPVNKTVCEFTAATFSVTATGTDLTYQWYVNKNDGNGFVTIIDGDGTYFGATSATLTISGATRLMTGFIYHAIVSDCSISVTSANATLSINNIAEITVQPKDSTICLNGGATFNVSATGTGVTYQWQVNKGPGFINVVNDVNFSGSTLNTLTIVNAPIAFNNYIFRVVVSGTCGVPVYSNFAQLRLNIPPSVSQNPVSKSICGSGGPVVFTSSGSGVIDSLRWQVYTGGIWSDIYDNTIYSGTTSQQLTLNNIPLALSDNMYRLSYKAKCVTVYSGSATLTVNSNPVVDFSSVSPLYACGDIPLRINTTPTGGSGTWNTHLWTGDVGPLDNYTIQSPLFTTRVVNSYSLNYKVTDSNGCSGSANVTVIVEAPDATYGKDKSNGCTPVAVTFSKTMTGITKFWWDFGDGSPLDSVNASPVHTFTNINPASVEYKNVKLTVKSSRGCPATYTSTITLYPSIDATFAANQNIVCSGKSLSFTATTPGASQYSWVFGDGATGFSPTETTSHLYTNFTQNPVIYTVRLTTTSFYSCTDTKTLNITVMPVPQPQFTPDPFTQIYKPTGNPVTFTNETNAGTWSWLWKFGDKSTSTVMNPVHSYTDLGDYIVTLIVNNSNCSDSVKHTVKVNPIPPAADFDSVMSGCSPLPVQLNNTSANTNQPGTSYRWTFGDGGTSTAKNPAYTYQTAGNYQIELTVTGPGGTSIKSRVVNAYPSPKASFEATPMKVFANDASVRFFNLSSDADYYIWEFGDGDTSKLKEPYHKYLEEGIYDISLWAYSNNGCSDNYILSPGVEVDPAGEIRFSTVFSPNKTGPIDRTDLPTGGTEYDMFFFPPIREKVMDYKLQIFNRLGVLIFESHDINTPWNGYYKGTICQQGVYVWYVEGKYQNGSPFRMVGNVTLLH